MKLSLEWLSEFVDLTGVGAEEYCDRMTETGSKVEGVENAGEDIENVVVGRILSVTPHENSDHLVVCMLDCGEGSPRQIVTGARNVFAGALVPVAVPPATLPGGVTIKAGKLRGVTSDGMLCSVGELGLTENDMPYAIADGILILDERDTPGLTPGTDIREALGLRDTVVDFEITPNRPDCLSVIGLARESGASFGKKVNYHTPLVRGGGDALGRVEDYLRVRVEDGRLCPRYTARVLKNVKVAPSPLWMRRRLRMAGVRPINNIVDITNYVMLEYGQPMHAFDYKCLDGRAITVRAAAEGETFRSLDDKDHTLRAGMLVIADEQKPVALAGVMGGANSEIEEDTETVVFESANFLGSSVRVTSRALGMRTESSARFEKGLDPENTIAAVNRACELAELLGAGEVVDGIIDVYPGRREATVLPLESEKINRFLGLDVPRARMEEILRSLDFTVEDGAVTVPSFRADVQCMNDLAEEVARMVGYNTIPATLLRGEVQTGLLTPLQKYREKLHTLLTGMGAFEICTFSFVSPKNDDKIRLSPDDPARHHTVIRNPLGEATSVMRTSMLPTALECLSRNAGNHGAPVRLYEIARCYFPRGEHEQPQERGELVFVTYGERESFYTVKGIAETLLRASGISPVIASCRDNPTYHPGRCAVATTKEGARLGVFGELHPEVAENYGFDEASRVYAIEFDVDALFAASHDEKGYTPLPKYPSTFRDLAFVCERDLEVGRIEEIISRAGGRAVESVSLFDIYEGKQVPAGKKSVAFRVTMRHADHTITDEEADKVVAKVLRVLEKELGVGLRE